LLPIHLQLLLLVLSWQLLPQKILPDFSEVSLTDFLHGYSLVRPEIEYRQIGKLPNSTTKFEILTADHIALRVAGADKFLDAHLGRCTKNVPALH